MSTNNNAKSSEKQITHSHEGFIPGGFGTTSKNQSGKSEKQISEIGSEDTFLKDKMYKQMVDLYNDDDWERSAPKVLVIIKKLLKKYPADGMLYYYKGGSHFFLGEYKKAIEAFNKAKNMLEQPPEYLQERLEICYGMEEDSDNQNINISSNHEINNSSSCDINISSTAKPDTKKNKKLLAGLMGIFLGGLGIHKFVLGYTKPGLIMLIGSLVTFGLLFYVFAIIGLIEGIIYLTKSDDDFYTTYQEGKKYWF